MKRLALILLLLPLLALSANLKEDTAVTLLVGPIVDSADASAETGLTLSQADIRLSKNGGNMAQKNEATSCTHDELGMYACPLDATDTNTAGVLTVTIGEAGTLVWSRDYQVQAASFYDLTAGATALLTSRDAGTRLLTTVDSVTSQIIFVLADGASNNDAYPAGASVDIIGGTEECEATVADYAGGTGTLTIATACPFTVAAGDVVRIRDGAAAATYVFADSTDSTVTDIAGNVDAIGVTLNNAIEVATGTCDSGSPTTCVDAALTEADADYWAKGIAFASLSGTTAGQRACVIDFDPATDTLTINAALTQAISTNTYSLISDASCSGVVLSDDSITNAKLAANAIGASELASNAVGAAELATDAVAEIWAAQCEDQGGGISCQGAISLLIAEAIGQCVYTSGTRTWVCEDPSGTETRFTIVYGAELDGDRTNSTPAPMTP